MKTPMQELLEWVRATLPMDLDTPRMIEEKIESMLPKEEKLIIKTYNHAVLHGMLVELGKEEVISAKQYYNKTFKIKER